MKKILSSCLFAGLVLLFSAGLLINAQAASSKEKNLSGTVSKIVYSQSGSSEEIRIYTTKTAILRKFVLAPNSDCRNYRIGIEIADAVINQNGAFDVNLGSVYQIRYANKQNPQAASIVIETTKKPDYAITPSSDGKCLLVTLKGTTTPSTASSKTSTATTPAASDTKSNSASSNTAGSGAISVSMQGDTCLIRFDGINLNTTFGSTGKKPSVELREKEKILQITIPGKTEKLSDGFISGNSVIYGVLVNYNKEKNNTYVRISYDAGITYTHEVSGGSSILKIKRTGSSASGSTGTTSGTGTKTPGSGSSSSPATPSPTTKTDNTTSRGGSSRSSVNVSYAASSVTITAASTKGYKIYAASNPTRIVIEVPGTVTAGEKTMPSGYLYQKAVLSQYNSSTARVELYASELPQWTVNESATSLKINLTKNGATNIQAGDGVDVALKLIGANIVGKYRQYANQIVSENEDDAFAFMFPAGLVDLGQGSVNINNGLVSSVTTLTTPSSSFLKIDKKDASKEFSIMEGSSANELLIVARSLADNSSSKGSSGNTSTGTSGNTTGQANGKLVVLDAGHGGTDPGTIFEGLNEKTFNLDITLKTEAILKQKGVNVKLTRSADVFVGLDERAEMANNWGADLFVSIHNNSMPAGMKGSMAFYYPASAKGKAYAKIVLDNLYNRLGMGAMGSGGLKSANYVVLRKTKMPAVLVEVACMSHSDDLNLLRSEAFRQKVAECLAESIIQILNQM